jgi:hypothetical protein
MADGGEVLLDRRLLEILPKTLDIGGDVQRLEIGDLADLEMVAPGEEPSCSPVIGRAALSPAAAITLGTKMPSRVATARVLDGGIMTSRFMRVSVKPISRASGRSAAASAAYRSAERLTNERDGLTHDFTRRGGVDHSEIVIPAGIDAQWALDRSALWKAAERVENRKDARVAREFEIALPHELNAGQRLEATREFAGRLGVRLLEICRTRASWLETVPR